LARHLEAVRVPVLLAVNKIDLGSTPTATFSHLHPFHFTHRISAVTGRGVQELLDALARILPEGPEYYPPETLTDRSERFIAQEFVREKVFELAGQEVPYSVAVTVEQWRENPGTGLVTIYATIRVERPSQKGIIIGKGGRLIKEIGRRARLDLEALLGTRVYLDLHVSVDRNWTRDPQALRRYGYEVGS
jgi:GTP-binding protein Era